AICELGSTIGAVEEVDINSLNSKEIVSWCQTFFVGMMTLLIWARGLRQGNEDEEFNDSEDDLVLFIDYYTIHVFFVGSTNSCCFVVVMSQKKKGTVTPRHQKGMAKVQIIPIAKTLYFYDFMYSDYLPEKRNLEIFCCFMRVRVIIILSYMNGTYSCIHACFVTRTTHVHMFLYFLRVSSFMLLFPKGDPSIMFMLKDN
ncbi:hypothetical protein ACJX0J_025341, partial [Zea mays]